MASSFSRILHNPRWAVLASALVLGGFLPADAAETCRAVVVRSAQLQPHLEVVRGIRDVSLCSIREVTLQDGDGPEKVLARSPDVVIAVGTTSLRKLKGIISIPVIYAMTVPSEAMRMQAPNIAGVSMDIAPASHLAAMHSLFPDRKRIGVLYDPAHTGPFIEDALKAASAAGLELVLQQVRDASRLPAALSALENRADILWMLPDPTIVSGGNFELLLRHSFERSVPIFTFSRKYVEMGAVASLDMDPYDIGVQAGKLANRVQTGSAAATEYARTGHMIVNVQVMRKMGLHPAEQGMRRATRID
jgi:putative ABC transport system substrate-binding protein